MPAIHISTLSKHKLVLVASGFLRTSPTHGLSGLMLEKQLYYRNPRTFIYSLLTKGRPFPALIFLRAAAFCTGNGVLQAYYLIYCAEYPEEWYTDARFCFGVLLFVLGMGVNIHSDHLLRQLRKPGEVTYKIPQGGLFTYVSGANYLGEIIEWMGYALAAWSVPALAFAFFSLCFLGIRAFNHHRFYLKMFKDYPKSRKALIPFIF
ncbi:3-oxo-5-alpha-steroid 4-dehydrogenase 2 isoform X2 [Meriones unguiculatus]|uniref:3-oxo-5-alpha-steroid 4-dehydrogenase 2 isoform X2 n=1 Tax=Meriones unguiculatus TaxID=10047 RepID=UPI00293E5F69|nr:3-oxo-5-alpha-steroid 4-dehydrogenase 2 isoform X2 [Meriones unguiculatus]